MEFLRKKSRKNKAMLPCLPITRVVLEHRNNNNVGTLEVDGCKCAVVAIHLRLNPVHATHCGKHPTKTKLPAETMVSQLQLVLLLQLVRKNQTDPWSELSPIQSCPPVEAIPTHKLQTATSTVVTTIERPWAITLEVGAGAPLPPTEDPLWDWIFFETVKLA